MSGLLHYTPRQISRQASRAFNRKVGKPRPRINEQQLKLPRKARRAMGLGRLVTLALAGATALFATQAEAFHAAKEDQHAKASSAQQLVYANVLALRFLHKGVTAGSGGGTPITIFTYDTSIGAGVGDDGLAILPLRPGAQVYYVRPGHGSASDAHNSTQAQDPTTPMNSIAAAAPFVRDGMGDRILVAEGTTEATGIPNFRGKSGFSATYPTIVETYNPADATNQAFWGRGHERNARVRIVGQSSLVFGGFSNGAASFVGFRGFDYDYPNNPNQFLQFFPNGGSDLSYNGDGLSYLLIENNVFRHVGLTVNLVKAVDGANPSNHLVIRLNSLYGMWGDIDQLAGNSFWDGWANVTLEDNVIYHAGWKIGASRDDPYTSGGATPYNHAYYAQSTNPGPFIGRRNLIIDPAADGGQARCPHTLLGNVYMGCPTAICSGGGTNYYLYRPTGIDFEVSYNGILEGADINSSNPAYLAVTTSNGRSGSSVHHNAIGHSGNTAGPNAITYKIFATYNQPSYCYFHHNVSYQWSTSSNTTLLDPGGFPAQCHPDFQFLIWDAPSSGTNVNVGSVSLPNPYTSASLCAALTSTFPGVTDRASMIAYAIDHPEDRIQMTMLPLILAGYGVDTTGMML